MTRRKFNQDVAAAMVQPIDRVSGIRNGDFDGQVDFVFTHDSLQAPLEISIAATSVDEYPDGSGFLVFTECENLSPVLGDAINLLSDLTRGRTVLEALPLVSSKLKAALEPANFGEDTEMTEADDWASGAEEEEQEEDDDEEEYDCDYDLSDPNIFGLATEWRYNEPKISTSSRAAITPILIDDLRKAKAAGFEIGLLTDMRHDGPDFIFSLSIHVGKLGVSDETLATWDVKSSDYLVLLFRFKAGYPDLDTFITIPPRSDATLQFRFGKCARFKPSIRSAIGALSTNIDSQTSHTWNAMRQDNPENEVTDDARFSPLYMSNSIDKFMRGEFAYLLKTRLTFSVSWDEAINKLKDHAANDHSKLMSVEKEQEDSSMEDGALVLDTAPDSLNQDYVLCDSQQRSLPLIAIQFALRYFVKSTQYCMVCHQKSETGFQAVKPYVCSMPLCLFQLMNFGFGPSIEHDIISQPYVVDILIGFCYEALRANKLREYPRGIPMKVPITTVAWLPDGGPNMLVLPIRTQARLGEGKLTFKQFDGWNIKANDIIVLVTPPLSGSGSRRDHMHHNCRVKSIHIDNFIVSVEFALIGSHSKYLVQSSGLYIPANTESVNAEATQAAEAAEATAATEATEAAEAAEEGSPADMFLYDRDFDDIPEDDCTARSEALISVLQTLPSVRDMREFLLKFRGSPLSKFDRISESAMSLLRWIVTSNRSFIVQLDQLTELDTSYQEAAPDREHEKVSGLDDTWMQFRFVQGSPEKEHKFNQELQLNKPPEEYPTIFAWHGSNLGNWHSIIRTGLDDAKVENGRSYGNGVYFSPDWSVSLGYSSRHYLHHDHTYWPGSELKVSSAIALCEIINVTNKFVCTLPYYVVQNPDWIKCRYLFVQRAHAQKTDPNTAAVPAATNEQTLDIKYVTQDPRRLVYGLSKQPIEVPMSVLPESRPLQSTDLAGSSRSNPIILDGEISNDEDDYQMLLEYEDAKLSEKAKDSREPSVGSAVLALESDRPLTPISYDPSKTTFRPGTLKIDELPRLPPPSWAGENGPNVVNRELRRLQKVQAQTPLQDLGWYMDFEIINNMYQWIVELHSFDESLPLAQDMKRHDVTSIVLEIRFGRQYPLSPPFVRVIRPRFLPFSHGGGGHVTAGGAMCMELLTNSGWSPANSMESVLVQVRAALCNLDPFPARLQGNPGNFRTDYGIGEAIDAYKRAARAHGWQIPPDLDQTANVI